MVPELETSFFIIPSEYVKNKDDRFVVLNKIAKRVVESQREKHPTHVFSYQGQPVQRIGNSALAESTKASGSLDVSRARSQTHLRTSASLAAISKLFNWSVERGYLQLSPALGVKPPAKEVSRNRVLSRRRGQAPIEMASNPCGDTGHSRGPLHALSHSVK